jgi:Tuberculosis necrotizing toxin
VGIELPAELVDVATAVGVHWPEADETTMASSASTWRQAGRRLGSLSSDADADARSALSVMDGEAADAARRHWDRYVCEDGRLTVAIRGCTAAADRLDHGAQQVAAAKTEIIRQLVELKQQQEAARSAHAAGFAHPLAALNTLLAGTASSIAQVQKRLTESIRLDNGGTVTTPDGSGVLEGAISGGHRDVDGLIIPDRPDVGMASAMDPDSTGPIPAEVASPPNVGTHGPGGHHPMSGAVDRAPDPAPAAHGLRVPDAPVQVHQASVSSPAGAGAPVLPHPSDGGPVGGSVGGPGGGPFGGPSPGGAGGGPFGGPSPGGSGGGSGFVAGSSGGGGSGGAGSSGLAGGHRGGPITGGLGAGGSGGSAIGGGHGGPGAGPGPVSGGGPARVVPGPAPATGLAPIFTGPIIGGPGASGSGGAPAGGIRGGLGGPSPVVGGPVPPGSPVPPGMPATGGAPAPATAVPGGALTGNRLSTPVGNPIGSPAGPGIGHVGPSQPGTSQPGQPGQPCQSAPPADPGSNQDRAIVDARRPRAGFLPGLPLDLGDPASVAERAARSGRPPGQDDPLTLFLFYLFPPDHAAQPAQRPALQLAAPPEQFGLAPGLCFPPGDHPQSGLVEGAVPDIGDGPLHLPVGLDRDAEPVRTLTTDYDPLGGMHEREWDRRFLVREADPERHVRAEYAWPPGEAYPEGGCGPDTLEPVVLEPGAVLDRFGDPAGRVFVADGTPYPQRSLPPDHQAHGYHRYHVDLPLPVWYTVSAAWFGQPGGGVRYRTTHSVTELVALGYLTDVTPQREATG